MEIPLLIYSSEYGLISIGGVVADDQVHHFKSIYNFDFAHSDDANAWN